MPGSNKSGKRSELGRIGEDVAVKYLERKGYTIVARNWRCAEGELDIVAKDGGVLCFIEVRTKSDADSGHPLETISGPKQRQVVKVATRYLSTYGLEDVEIRLDAIGLVAHGKTFDIRHIENAFEAW